MGLERFEEAEKVHADLERCQWVVIVALCFYGGNTALLTSICERPNHMCLIPDIYNYLVGEGPGAMCSYPERNRQIESRWL